MLYHFSEGERLTEVQALLQTLGIESVLLPEAAWGEKIGHLLGLKGFQKNAACSGEFFFPHEVMIFYQLENRRLDQVLEAFQTKDVPRVRYKAVVTPMNRFWTLRRLCETMEKEHAYLTQREESR